MDRPKENSAHPIGGVIFSIFFALTLTYYVYILLPMFWSARSFVPARLISVAQLSLWIDSRSRGCGEVGSA